MLASTVGIILSLLSAITWGGGDFCGGVATRKNNQYAVLAFSAISGIAILIICHLIWPEPFPSGMKFVFAVLAGTCGIFGLGALYKALSIGHSALVAPTSAVIGALIPVVYASISFGFPGLIKVAGFVLAFVGIWLTTFITTGNRTKLGVDFWLAIIAGLGFGFFFIFISEASVDLTFTPLIVSRSTFFLISFVVFLTQKKNGDYKLSDPLIWATGILDATGNALFILAKQSIRVDVAVVISSLYPAATVILANRLLKEKISRPQWIGVALCISSVMIISI